MRVPVDATGRAGAVAVDDDAPIESTHKSVVYSKKYYAIAERHRNETSPVHLFDPQFAEWILDAVAPGDSPRSCEVHSCVLIEGDEACAEGRPDCDGPRGHLRPFGEQWEALTPVPERDASVFDAPSFWKEAMGPFQPVLIRGGAAASTDLNQWTHEALARRSRGLVARRPALPKSPTQRVIMLASPPLTRERPP